MSNCAYCAKKPCTKNSTEGAPKDCPGYTHSPEEMLGLYSEEEKKEAFASALTEAENYCRATRVEEIMDYAHKCGYHKLGLAFCAGLSTEAQIFADILRSNGFEVESVCCKNGRVPKAEIGITQEMQAHPECPYEIMCNPIGQALVLDEAKCDLAIVLGLCVGHDTLFIRHINAPCTVLSTKDRVMGHNALAALYTAKSYKKGLYNFIQRKYGDK